MDKLLEPPVNLSEANGDLVLAVPMPGTEPDSIRIRIGDSNEITVEALPRGQRGNQAKWYLHEWRVGDYNRTLKLPYPIDSGRVNATYDNGVLTVSMPRGTRTTEREIRLQTVGEARGAEVGHRGQVKEMTG